MPSNKYDNMPLTAPEWLLALIDFLTDFIYGMIVYTLYWGVFQLIGLMWDNWAFGFADQFPFFLIGWGGFCVFHNLKNRRTAQSVIDNRKD